MNSATQFYPLRIARVTPEAAGAVVLTLQVPAVQRALFAFLPGQFLTLKANINCETVRRNYSICSTPQRLAATGEVDVGIKPILGGVFSNWAATRTSAGDLLDVMPPDGRFVSRLTETGGSDLDRSQGSNALAATRPLHRAGFAAGSGITPLLSLVASTLAGETHSQFTLVYANQQVGQIMFNEQLQDLKDRYPARLNLIHVLSRQEQDIPLLHGRLDAVKMRTLLETLLPVDRIDEAFVCGPAGMMDAAESVLKAAFARTSRPERQVHVERFFAGQMPATLASGEVLGAINSRAICRTSIGPQIDIDNAIVLKVIQDGKVHHFTMAPDRKVLDTALAGGLDLPYACRGGVCCTCRARVLEGRVQMEKNFTLEAWEVDKGFVLTCQARALTPEVTVSFDER